MVALSLKVKDLLERIGTSVITIKPDETLLAAIQKLVENNIGALPVCDAKGTLLGIISEIDLLKEFSRDRQAMSSIKVKDVMTENVVIAVPEDELDYLRDVMTQKGIRHLPVLNGQKLEGIVSMRDVVDMHLSESKATIRFLNDYISGGYV